MKFIILPRRVGVLFVALLTVVALVVTVVTPVSASGEPQGNPAPATTQPLSDEEGTPTMDQPITPETLIFEPIQIQVSSAPATASIPIGLPVPAAARITRIVCTTLDAQLTVRTTLNFVAYRYHHKLVWCWNGRDITSIRRDIDYLRDVDSNFRWRGTVTESSSYSTWRGSSTGHYTSDMQGEVENCVPKITIGRITIGGCIGTSYPWITIDAYGNGTHSTSSGL